MKFKKIVLGLLTVLLTTTLVLVGSNKVLAASTPMFVKGAKQMQVNNNELIYVVSYGGNNFEFELDSGETFQFNEFFDYKGPDAVLISGNKQMLITNDESVYVVSYGGNNFEFELDSGETFQFSESFTLLLDDNKIPVISGKTTFVTNVDEEKPLSYFMSFLSAHDETDGDVTDSLTVVTDNYTQNIRVLGNHTFTVEASDNSGNTATATINIRVVDIVAPIISGNTSTAEIGYAETWNIENFRKTLTVTDNYQSMTNADIEVDTDGYTANKTKLGTYTITFKASDASGNTGTFSKKVRVVDNVAPTFSGPTTIATSNNTVLTESDIRAQLTANDFIDGNITNRIELVEDNFTGKGNKVGSYTLVYSVTDNAGNPATHTVTVQRTDKIPPTIWVEDGASIRTTPDTQISRDTIIDILEATGQIQINATTTFSFPLDEYSGNEETPGVYAMTLKARSTDGNESVHSFAIEVLDVGNNEDPITREPSEWIQDNIVWLIVGGVALIGGAYFITKRK